MRAIQGASLTASRRSPSGALIEDLNCAFASPLIPYSLVTSSCCRSVARNASGKSFKERPWLVRLVHQLCEQRRNIIYPRRCTNPSAVVAFECCRQLGTNAESVKEARLALQNV